MNCVENIWQTTVKNATCTRCDDILSRRTDSRVAIHKFHGHKNDDEVVKVSGKWPQVMVKTLRLQIETRA